MVKHINKRLQEAVDMMKDVVYSVEYADSGTQALVQDREGGLCVLDVEGGQIRKIWLEDRIIHTIIRLED